MGNTAQQANMTINLRANHAVFQTTTDYFFKRVSRQKVLFIL